MKTAREMTVKGMVQGVGFRWTCKRIADGLGLAGFARNNPDGTVTVLVAGSDADIEHFLLDLEERMGQYITEISARDVKAEKNRVSFEIMH